MKFALVAVATALLRKEGMTCNPKTEVCLALSKTAAGDVNWECKPAVDGAKEMIPEAPDYAPIQAKVCGPGLFQFSPMQCAGDNFAYKMVGEETLSKDGSGCKILPFPYDMSCYAVDCSIS